MKIFFTADTHFSHANIIKYANRPFKNVEHMDKILIKNWNDLVNPEDTIYHLGDFAFKDVKGYVEKLNGNIHLIRGSHDKGISNSCHWFTSISDLKSIVIDNQMVVLCHYAMRTWRISHYNSWQLYGHSHGRLKSIGKQYDVGVDYNNYRPLSWDDIIEIMGKKSDNPNLVKKR